jgi:glycosyltransferase involved in cell wall biosynthesis
MNIVYIYEDFQGRGTSNELRCVVPARAINRTKRHTARLLKINDLELNSQEIDQICSTMDVIVVHCNVTEQVLSAIQRWKAQNKIIIIDFDIAYNLLESTDPSYPYWHELNKASYPQVKGPVENKLLHLPLSQFKWGLRLAHAATVPSHRLADDWREYTDVIYLPNYIDQEIYFNVKLEPHEGINIGWGGGKSHLHSFMKSGVLEALHRVCAARPEVKVIIAGGDKRLYDLLLVPELQKVLIPWVPYSQWAQVLSKFDIGLAPLYGKFDERRSWINVLEYMVMKIPWVGSAGPPYFELGDFGKLIKNDPSAWEYILLDLIDNLHAYKLDASQVPYLFGISQSVDENVEKIIEIYQNLVNKKSTLRKSQI